MAAKTKKVILFIVEGPTDENTLSPIFKKIFQNEEVLFHVVHGDVTSEWLVNSTNAIKTVYEHIKVEMDRYGFRSNDIIKVIHLIDTDGAFIPSDCVVTGNVEKLCYEENRIISQNPQNTIKRNSKKTQVLSRLYPTSVIGRTIPYFVYYFSRNMEHVMHNISDDLSDDEKMDYADCLIDVYQNNTEAFIHFLADSDFTVQRDYRESWRFVFEGTNSLHRYCNLHLLFQEVQ
ncbi:MAG TPA: hypothetical protein DDW65_09660 [Firmicutes bacterium]|jgi:hypothetical protein|nr:hypothetical protein [Bacillota bacterium]